MSSATPPQMKLPREKAQDLFEAALYVIQTPGPNLLWQSQLRTLILSHGIGALRFADGTVLVLASRHDASGGAVVDVELSPQGLERLGRVWAQRDRAPQAHYRQRPDDFPGWGGYR